jgi:GTP1/Obg family GTP-binding protein
MNDLKDIDPKWPKIWVCGATCSGKSMFINKFIGKDVAEIGDGTNP